MNKQKTINATRVFNARFNSIVSISLVLLLTGIMIVLGLVANRLSKHVKENITLSVIVDDEMRLPDVKMFQQRLEASPWVKSVEYVNKESALKDLTENLGENPEDFLGYNPLLASFDIFLNADYANTDSINVIEKSLKLNKGVEDVIYRKDLVHLVNENVRRISVILLVLAFFLTIISFSLIRNTVRLMIYSKRFLIRTMQLVGASNNFIRKPFLIENLWTGIISAVVATIILTGLMTYVEQRLSGSLQLLDFGTMVVVFFSLLIFGLLIIISATWLAVTRYLKMNVSDLYYV
ncbi:MAG TPA: permease-like cell division protein FtsX [Bacteroidales bacterium]|nr:permease-like cell division protein FtsX [Bacteroidales bacterium]